MSISIRDKVDTNMLAHYRNITQRALDSVVIAVSKDSHLYTIATDMLDMANRYFSDAQFFEEKGDYISALGAIYYAHAWLDVGVRIGVLKAETNGDLFTLGR